MASLKEKIGYALGDAAAGGITWKIMSIAFPLFFTSVFGLTVADTAALMLIARMFDVVTDPLMGALADRTRSKFGTYRPWIIFGAIPFGLIFALLLYTPDFGPVGKRIWAYTFYLVMMAMYTAVNVPYGSLLGVMTDDDNEKNQFSSFRMVGAYAMGFITLFAFPYVQRMVGGSEQHQYAVIGIVFGAIAALGTLACGLLTKERLKPVRAEKFSFKPFKDLFKNKPWIYLTLIGICTNFFNGFRYAAAGYMFDYVLGKEITISSLIINYTVFMTFGEVTCMIFGGLSPKFTQWVGSKRKAFIWAALICVFFSVLFFFIPRDASYIWVLIAIVVLTSVGIGLYSPLLWSMYADVADYATEKNGTSSTGLIFSSGTMAQKFGTAISGSLVVLLMGIAGFSSGTMSVNDKIVPKEGAVNVTYVDQKEQKQSLISIKGDEAKKFMEWSTLANSDIISNADGKMEVNSDGLSKLRNRIASLSGDTQLTTVEMDKSGNNTVITIEKMESVRSMVWMLFSIFPAIFALLIVFLTKLYPIKK